MTTQRSAHTEDSPNLKMDRGSSSKPPAKIVVIVTLEYITEFATAGNSGRIKLKGKQIRAEVLAQKKTRANLTENIEMIGVAINK